MSRNEKIRSAVERVIDVFRRKPSAALDTIRASGRIEHGLVCNARQGDYTAVMDMAEAIGGDGSAPTPGFFIRAGLEAASPSASNSRRPARASTSAPSMSASRWISTMGRCSASATIRPRLWKRA